MEKKKVLTHLAGSLGNSVFVHFFWFLILRISGFSPFARISRSGWFFSFLVSSFGRQFFFLGFESTHLARQVQQEHTQMEVQ